MKNNPVWHFDDTTQTGINTVPLDAKIIIKDSDGNGTPKELLKIAAGALDETSTIADFLNDSTLFAELGGSLPDTIEGGTY